MFDFPPRCLQWDLSISTLSGSKLVLKLFFAQHTLCVFNTEFVSELKGFNRATHLQLDNKILSSCDELPLVTKCSLSLPSSITLTGR